MYLKNPTSNYTILRRIGNGASSKVELAYDSINCSRCALKILHGSRSENFKNELKFFNEVPSHPNLVSLINYDPNRLQLAKGDDLMILEQPYLAMEYCSKGSMFHYISNLKSFAHPIARFYSL